MRNILTIIFIVVLLGVGIFTLANKQKTTEGESTEQSTSPQTEENLPNENSKNILSVGGRPNIDLKLPDGYQIRIFADGISSARDLQFSEQGTLLVSSPNRSSVYALPDRNGDGVADSKKVVVDGGHNPHGLAFYKGKLYVAETTKATKYSWDENGLSAKKEKDLFALPPNNNHNRRTIAFDIKGQMFISVGSTCNVCNEDSNFSATVLTADAEGNNLRVFAKGLRNAPFLEFNQKSGKLWATEMGRDLLGDNIPPDEIDILEDGKDYGWPNCWGNKVADTNFNPSASCGNTIAPIFEIPAHSAPLGLTFINSEQFPTDWQGDLLVAYHGSWNRSTPTGYKVVRLKVEGEKITGAEDFLTGFISAGARSGNDAKGRPVDVAFDKKGNLFISDDKADAVYIVQKQQN